MTPVLIALLLAAPRPSVAETEKKAAAADKAGRTGEALVLFEQAIRLANNDPDKLRLRDAYIAAGWADPRPVGPREQQVLNRHVRDEKARLWRAAAGRFENRKKLHAAILTYEAVAALFVDPKVRKRERGPIKRIVHKLTRQPTAEEKKLAERVIAAAHDGKALLKQARKIAGRKQYRFAVRLCQEMLFGDYGQEIQNEARALRERIEQEAAADVPIPERQAVDDLLADERFDRLAVERSRHFLYLGPKEFVEKIPNDQRTLLDLAYIFQSDLSARNPTVDGNRVVLYYQETFDFGGGLAHTPGKLIRIGNRAIRLPVAGFLHYHELGHCILGKGWLYPGFTEGLADFAAGFTLDMLGQTGNARNFINGAREQFVRFYLGREMRYASIQPYRPSAGFLFSLLPPGDAPHDWGPYRRVFQRMREAQFGEWPEREDQLMRYFGYLLATEYGPRIFDRLAAWGFPVSRRDFEAVPEETAGLLREVRQGEYHLNRDLLPEAKVNFSEVLKRGPDSTLASRARFGLLRIAAKEGRLDDAKILRAHLGILDDYLVVGSFRARGRTADIVFPPERGPLDVGAKVGTAVWKKAKPSTTGYVDLVAQRFGYPENACAFAVTYVKSDRTGGALLLVGSDDGHLIQVNGRLVAKRTSSRRFRFDDQVYPISLQAGWNRFLFKVHNRRAPWGFLARVTGLDGEPLPGFEVSAQDHEAFVPRFEIGKQRAVKLASDEFKSFSALRWRKAVGKWDTQNGRLRPQGTGARGFWNRFVVNPDKPATGPTNLVWFRHPALPGAGSFELELTVAAQGEDGLPARFGLTLFGESGRDGQSGHTIVFDRVKEKLSANWYRYDSLLYYQPGVKIEKAARYTFVVRHLDGKWWLSVNGVALFERTDAPRLPAFGVGLMTWGTATEFESFRFSRLVREDD